MKQRFFIMLSLTMILAVSAFAKPDYDRLRNFNGEVIKMTLSGDKFSETIYFDNEGYKIFAEIQDRDYRGTVYNRVTAFDHNGARVIYSAPEGSGNISKKIIDSYKHADDIASIVTMEGLKFVDKDSHGNWTQANIPGFGKITRQLIYADDAEAAEITAWAERQRKLMFDQENVGDENSPKAIGEAGLAFGLGAILCIPLMLVLFFGICILISYKRVRNYFNRRAGENILSSSLKLHRREAIAAIIGGVYGTSVWAGATIGSDFNAIIIIGTLVWLAIAMTKLYKRGLSVASPKAAKWYVIYSTLLALSCWSAGAALSVFAIAIAVGSLFGKGINAVWDDEITHKDPREGGSATTRQCAGCSNYSNGYYSYHNRPMPPTGGCGVR